ncbi:DNA helicase [Branchiostoma belcheri]|nr:DNA helicase [Branchiostoma belcheri]
MELKFGKEGVAVVAPTGKAAVLINGQTVHSFFCLGLGQKEANQIFKQLDKISFDRIHKIKVIICDEVSMLSSAILQKLHTLLQMIKQNRLPFGGVRLVFAGDFFQLPPIDLREDELTPDFCFLSDTWEKAIDLCIFLTGVYRQENPQFLTMLEELRMGRRTPECLSLMAKLTRPLPKVDMRLYSLRRDMNAYNERQIATIEGMERRYVAQDMGTAKASLDKLCQAPQILVLKKGAPVILLQNLFSISSKLVNGATGIVNDFSNGHPLITFQTGETHIIEQHMFGYYENGRLIASRWQYPLQLGFSMTVHKSQGSTLTNMEVVDIHMFAPGQQYTAYTRATSPESFRVLPGFSKHVVKPHPLVINFYRGKVHALQDLVTPNISKGMLSSGEEEGGPVHLEGGGDQVHISSSTQDPILEVDETFPSIAIPDGYDPCVIIQLLKDDLSPFENLLDLVLHLDVQRESLRSLFAYLILQLEGLCQEKTLDKTRGKDVITRKAFTSHIGKIMSLTGDREAKARWKQETNTSLPHEADTVLTRLITVIYKHVAKVNDPASELKEKLESDLEQVQPNRTHYNASKANCGKVRYLMGWTVYRVFTNLESQLKTLQKHTFKGKKATETEARIIELRALKSLCCSMTGDQTSLQLNSRYKFSLEHIDRRNRGGLFVVNDNIFLFGMALESLCGKLFRVEVVDILGKESTKTISNIVRNNQLLKTLFVQYLNNDYIPDVQITLSHIPVNMEEDPASVPEVDPVHMEGEVDPVHMEGEGDPAHMEGEGDPVHMEGEVDPVHMEGEGDPAHMEGEGDPAHMEGEGDPAHMEGEGDPAHMEGEGDPVHMEGEVDPVHMEGEVDPVHMEGEGDPAHMEGEGDPAHMEGEVDPVHMEGEVDPVHMEGEGDPGDMEVDPVNTEGGPTPVQTIEKLCSLIIAKYLNMRNKEFLRPLSEKLNTQKETALRPALQAKSKKSSMLTFTSFLDDKTASKEFSHLHLKSLAVKGADSFSIFTVAQIKLFLLCYGKTTKSTSKKDIMKTLTEVLKSNDSMVYSHRLTSKNLEDLKKGKVPQVQNIQVTPPEDHPPVGATSVDNNLNNSATESTQGRETVRQRARRFCPTEDQIRILRDDHVNGNPVHLHQTRADQFGQQDYDRKMDAG